MTKQEQREILKSRMNELNLCDNSYESKIICSKVLQMRWLHHANVILSYYPMATEVDLRIVNQYLSEHNKIVAYPVIYNNEILAYASKDDCFVKGKYGIMQPDPRSALMIEKDAIDVVLVPCLGFDSKRHRLGYGGGYYDRYLKDCNAYKIAVGFSKQQLDHIITEEHDVLMDCIISADDIF